MYYFLNIPQEIQKKPIAFFTNQNALATANDEILALEGDLMVDMLPYVIHTYVTTVAHELPCITTPEVH